MSLCGGCGSTFDPWSLSGKGRFVSRWCRCCVDGTKRRQVFDCLGCHQHIDRWVEGLYTSPTFCNKSCRMKYEYANNIRRNFLNDKTTWEWWVSKYGEEEALRRKEHHRDATSLATSGENNPMYGRHDHVHGLKRFAKEKTGKTLEEVHGVDLARKMRENKSLHARGSNNPAYGKVYTKGGKSIKGYYKDKFFRSLLEYSFMKHLESEGLSLNIDVDYECFIVPYVFNGADRTYRVDFYVPSRHAVYEVKPAYAMKGVTPINEAKWSAARVYFNQRGIQFYVMSELDFPKIMFDIARQDSDVTWKEETFKYFKRSK